MAVRQRVAAVSAQSRNAPDPSHQRTFTLAADPVETGQQQSFGYSSQKHLRRDKGDIPSSYRVQKIAVVALNQTKVSVGRGQ